MKKKKYILIIALITLAVLSAVFFQSIRTKPGLVLKEKEQRNNIDKLIFHSNILDKEMVVNVFLPNGYNKKIKYPVLYMLHGFSGNADAWFSYMQIHEKAQKLIDEGKIEPLIIVSPQMDNSYGINSSRKSKEVPITEWGRPSKIHLGMYEDYLYKEIISYIDLNYNTITEKSGRYVGGLSMGGYIALRTAFRHPELFSKVGGHSPGIYLEKQFTNPQFKDWLYPNEKARENGDPLYLAQNTDLSNLEIYLDCGESDLLGLYQGTEALFNTLNDRNVSVQYHSNPGDHDINYWRKYTEEYLLFYGGK